MSRRTKRQASCLVALAAVLCLTACGAADRDGVRPTRRDSAGVEIVENVRADSTALPWWTLGPQPRLDIGTVEGTDVLFGVVDVVRLTDGRIVIATSGDAQVHYYSADGQHLLTSGRRGAGPGEFQRITGLLPMPADSVAVLDGTLRRVTVLAPDGQFTRTVLGSGGGRVNVVGRRGDGTWLAQSNAPPSNNTVKEGLLRPDVMYVTLPPEGGAVTDTLGHFPGSERMLRVTESRGEISSIGIMTPPFAKATSFVAAGNDLVVGTQDAAEVRVYGSNGALRRIVRTGTPTQRVTAELLDAYVTRQVARLPREQQQAARENQMAIVMAKEVPPYGTLALDRSGNLWLQDYPGLEDDQRWTIFDPDGALIARIALPSRFTPYDIGEDWILGRELDDLDVEHVRLYGVRRSEYGRAR